MMQSGSVQSTIHLMFSFGLLIAGTAVYLQSLFSSRASGLPYCPPGASFFSFCINCPEGATCTSEDFVCNAGYLVDKQREACFTEIEVERQMRAAMRSLIIQRATEYQKDPSTPLLKIPDAEMEATACKNFDASKMEVAEVYGKAVDRISSIAWVKHSEGLWWTDEEVPTPPLLSNQVILYIVIFIPFLVMVAWKLAKQSRKLKEETELKGVYQEVHALLEKDKSKAFERRIKEKKEKEKKERKLKKYIEKKDKVE